MRYLLSLLLLFAMVAPPTLAARWDGPGRATITWSGPGCVYRNQTLLLCDWRDVGHQIVLGEGLTDAAYRPAGGDVYTLWQGGRAVARAELRSVQYLPAMY